MRPLSKTRVLDLSRLIPGPFATLVLADLGASVDKIEDPGGGDYLRHMPPSIGDQGAAFQLLNRGKRSAILDLKQPAARDAVLRMLGTYDVVFEQFRPGVLKRLGLDPADLLRQHPRLIVCSLTGYGQHGELAQKAGHDLNYLARSGLLGFQGPTGGPPAVPAVQLADISGGMWSVIAILSALMHRDQVGTGQHLDIAMTDGVLGFASASLGAALAGVCSPAGTEVLSGGIAPYGTYLSKDDQPVTLAALEPKFWAGFCKCVGIEPDLSALMPGDHQPALRERLEQLFRTKTHAEWRQFAAENDVMVEVVVAPEEIRADTHLQSRNLFFNLGGIPQFRTPVTPTDDAFTPPPAMGQHTREILHEGGISDAEIDALLGSGAAREVGSDPAPKGA